MSSNRRRKNNNTRQHPNHSPTAHYDQRPEPRPELALPATAPPDAQCATVAIAPGTVAAPSHGSPSVAASPQSSATMADIGARLRCAREARGLTVGDAAQQLRLPARVLRRLETDQLSGIDCPVYLRGYLRSYGKLLDIDLPSLQTLLSQADVAVPELKPRTRTSRGRYLWQRYSVAASYVIITVLIVVPVVVFGLRGSTPRDGAQTAPLAAGAASPSAAANPASDGRAATQPQPLMASMAPFDALHADIDASRAAPAPDVAAAPVHGPGASKTTTATATVAASAHPHVLDIHLSAPSWVEVTDASGQRLEYGLLQAGDYRYHSDQVLRVRLGNSATAAVTVDGHAFGLQPYRRANIAEFRVNLATGKPPTTEQY